MVGPLFLIWLLKQEGHSFCYAHLRPSTIVKMILLEGSLTFHRLTWNVLTERRHEFYAVLFFISGEHLRANDPLFPICYVYFKSNLYEVSWSFALKFQNIYLNYAYFARTYNFLQLLWLNFLFFSKQISLDLHLLVCFGNIYVLPCN